MRKGKSKSIEDHILDGTYRPDFHGIKPSQLDLQRLNLIKDTIYYFLNKTKDELSKTDMIKNPDKYKSLNDVMLCQLKTYYSLIKYKIIE